jgi:hypothetical protein
MRLVRALVGVVAALALSACNERDNFGYVEVRKAISSTTDTFSLNAVPLTELPRKGVAVIRQPPGPAKLDVTRGERTYTLCSFDVGKNRIVTVTLSLIEGQLRCVIQK